MRIVPGEGSAHGTKDHAGHGTHGKTAVGHGTCGQSVDGKEDIAAGKRNAADAEKKGGMNVKRFLMILSILAVVGMAVLNLTYDDTIKPDEVYPFTNQKISWN